MTYSLHGVNPRSGGSVTQGLHSGVTDLEEAKAQWPDLVALCADFEWSVVSDEKPEPAKEASA